jgi:hypothetical protein
MPQAYVIIGLIACIWLVVQGAVSPRLAAAGYGIGYGILLLLFGAHWLEVVVTPLVSFGLTYVYLSGIDLLRGWKFWACFACGPLVIFLTRLAAEQVLRLFGLGD